MKILRAVVLAVAFEALSFAVSLTVLPFSAGSSREVE